MPSSNRRRVQYYEAVELDYRIEVLLDLAGECVTGFRLSLQRRQGDEWKQIGGIKRISQWDLTDALPEAKERLWGYFEASRSGKEDSDG